MEMKAVTAHYRERMQRILLFEPLYRLKRRELKQKDGGVVSFMELGLLTLLFFFESMLFRRKDTGVRELAVFLREITQGVLSLSTAEYEKAAREIIAAFRPSTGRRNEVAFFNWDTRENDKAQYSILKAHRSDISNNQQYYVLDEQGLELIFATKEYFSEFQLSINQLILRKQLEKGEFASALRQIEEMYLDVHALRERILKVSNEIHRNIVSEDTLARYNKMICDINLRMEREGQEFLELKEFVKTTRDKIGDNLINDLDRKAYENILEVDRKLGDVHAAHRSLLKMAIDLKTSALNAAEESLYFTGVELFNFQQELTKKMFACPLPLQTARALVKPFLHLEQAQLWSPLSVFFAQRLEADEKEALTHDFPELAEKSAEQAALRGLQADYLRALKLIFTAMGERREVLLSEVVAYLKEINERHFLASKQFYLLWIFLHRKSPFAFNAKEISDKSAFYEAVQAMSYIKQVTVVELPEILLIEGRYKISDMRLAVEVE